MIMTFPARSPSGPISSALQHAGALALITLGACNAIFGIEPGLPGGTTASTASGPTCANDSGPATGAPIKLLLSGAPDVEQASALTYDSAGNLFVGGSFNGSTFNLGKSIAHLGAAGSSNAFVAKYDASGAYLWSQAFGGTTSARFNGAGVDAAGNVYLIGAYAGTVSFGATSLTAGIDPGDPGAANTDVVVVSLDPQGNVRWAKSLGNDSVDLGLRITVDPAGNSYIAGASFNPLDFGEGSGPIGDTASWWSFFAKLDGAGETRWVVPIGRWGSVLTPDYIEYFEVAIALDGKGHAVIGGNFSDQVVLGVDTVKSAGGFDALVAALDDSTGALVWHQTFHQPAGDPASDGDQWITALTTDPCTGDVYAAGCFTRGIDFESRGGAKVSLGDPLDPDTFVVKLAAGDGAPLWFRTFGDAGRQEPTAVKVGPDGTVLLGGYFVEAAGSVGVDIGAPIGVLAASEPSPGPDYNDSDAFLIKLDATSKTVWGKRLGDKYPQAAFDVAVKSTGEIAFGGIATGTLAIGGGKPPLSADDFDAFVARFDP